jgi:hypothetical protein
MLERADLVFDFILSESTFFIDTAATSGSSPEFYQVARKRVQGQIAQFLTFQLDSFKGGRSLTEP